MLTAAQQDYLETIYRLELQQGAPKVRVTDIAAELGTRLPTVTRTVRRLTDLGYLSHQHRQEVSLSMSGRKVAAEVVHRHSDLVEFFTEVLGLRRTDVEVDVCQIEHGISARTAQRLHEFLEYINNLDNQDRKVIKKFLRRVSSTTAEFPHLPAGKTAGWRG